MGFGDLRNESGLSILNDFLAGKSYIEGFQPSQADVVVFRSIPTAPTSFLHALRWYSHIQSFTDMDSLPGVGKNLDDYGPTSITSTSKAKPDDKPADDDDDDDFDLFGDTDDEDEEAERMKAERVAAYNAKKSKKPKVTAKSSIVLDVKPWDDETSLEEIEKMVRTIECDGLIWGKSKIVPIGYGIKKLQIGCVVEDDKCGSDYLEEKITAFEELVQSVDIAAFQKV